MNDKLAASQNSNFHIFPSENFIDLCLYQYGHENALPDICLDLQHGIIIFFIMYSPVQVL